MTIQVQRFDGSIYVVVGQHAMFLEPKQAEELAAKLAKVCVIQPAT
jgi:hypothetical protein